MPALLVAILDWAMTVILEAVNATFRVLLDVRTLSGIAILIGVLLALPMTRTVVCRISSVMHAVLSRRGSLVLGIARVGECLVLREESCRAVRADSFQPRWLPGRNGVGADDEEKCDPHPFHDFSSHW